MSRKNSTNESKVNLQKNEQNTVWIANGAGNMPIEAEWQPGDTVGSILEREQIEIAAGHTAVLGQRRVCSMSTPVEPGETIVIADMPSNG